MVAWLLDSVDLVFVLHVGATLYMTGLIWFVQCVHYPLMNRIAAPDYAAFELAHIRRTTWVVGPAMLVESLTAVVLLVVRPDGLSSALSGANVVMLIGIWLSTALLQVPAHRRLERGFDVRVHARLVRTNWLRTLLWSGRSLLLLASWPG